MSYTYKDVINAAIKDFESFFTEESNFSVSYEIANANFYAKIRGSNNQSRLLFGNILAGEQINTVDDIMFCLIIVGHELAHYVNRHVSYLAKEPVENIVIESWADYFGARIMFALITFGDMTKKLLATFTTYASVNPLEPKVRQDIYLRSCGWALLRMFQTLYEHSDYTGKYPRSSMRVSTFAAGVTSFLYRLFGDLKESWALYVYRRIIIDNGLATLAYSPDAKIEDESFFLKTLNIHIEIKGREKTFITAGLKPSFIRLIGTDYEDDAEGRLRRKQRFKDMYSSWSFPVEV